MKKIDTITTDPRKSNFELLRMLAMFLVLVTHSDYVSLGLPTIEDFHNNPLNAYTRCFFESVSIVCVNVFILISGWFGIKPSIKSFSNFIFQCVFFLFGLYIAAILTNRASLSTTGILECLCLTRTNWFIISYIGLYILSPLLNQFLKTANKHELATILIIFYLYQTYFGVLRSAAFIAEGYSTFSFIGLYLLAYYLRNYGAGLYKYGLLLYIGSVLINTLMYPFAKRLFPFIITYNYINPFVIIGSIGLLFCFSKINISTNKTINYISKSSFAVYLLHTNQVTYNSFIETINSIYNNYTGVECIFLIFMFLIIVFCIAIFCDLPRRAIWYKIAESINWGKI